MNNILIICRKELKSYFVSPIAYGLMAFFAVIAGYIVYVATAFFIQQRPRPMAQRVQRRHSPTPQPIRAQIAVSIRKVRL